MTIHTQIPLVVNMVLFLPCVPARRKRYTLSTSHLEIKGTHQKVVSASSKEAIMFEIKRTCGGDGRCINYKSVCPYVRPAKLATTGRDKGNGVSHSRSTQTISQTTPLYTTLSPLLIGFQIKDRHRLSSSPDKRGTFIGNM